MSSVPVPGPSGLLSRLSFEKDGKRGIATLRRKPQRQRRMQSALRSAVARWLLVRARKRQAKATVRTFAITVRLGWLARAAFVFVCYVSDNISPIDPISEVIYYKTIRRQTWRPHPVLTAKRSRPQL